MTAAALLGPVEPVTDLSERPDASKLLRVGPLDRAGIDEVLECLAALPVEQVRSPGRVGARREGARRVLAWLADHDGDGWQQRWQHAGADFDTSWTTEVAAGFGGSGRCPHATVTDGMTSLLLGRVVLPDHGFFYAHRTTALIRCAKQVFGTEAFAAIARAGKAAGFPEKYRTDAERTLVKLALHTGRDLPELTAADLLDMRDWYLAARGKIAPGLHAAWDLLRDTGLLHEPLPLRRMDQRQLTTAQLVGRYEVRCAPVRQALTRYLDERRPALDYGSLLGLASRLVGNFWCDLETHHPGIDSLRLTAHVTEAWRQRIAYTTPRPGKPPVERRNRLGVLMTVRAFYLDIAQWALEDPYWAPFAVPSPVRASELVGLGKMKKEAEARSHQRVRERLPRLEELVDTADAHLREQQELLAAARATAPGGHFEHDGRRWHRPAPGDRDAHAGQTHPTAPVTARDERGFSHDLTRAEDEAFWAWAIIETLRHTGIRCEELLEITQLALVSYRLADTGEIVPLLQIVPSKSNEERLLLVSPELASVLATIISRLRAGNGGAIPLVPRYDPIERTIGPDLPHLFQRRLRWKHDVLTPKMVRDLLNATVARSGLTDPAGQPLIFKPHDFRRIFTTQAVAGGLPVHIAARVLGHASVTTIETYLAVFQDDLIRSYRSYLNARRADRPAEEYREPTDAEWHEFQEHFHTRKLELGDCARPYGTPCNHEHACIRCPMLRVDPAQRRRLEGIIRNLTDRVDEARANGWLGEVQGLQVSIEAARSKLASLDRLARNRSRTSVNLGMPTSPAERS